MAKNFRGMGSYAASYERRKRVETTNLNGGYTITWVPDGEVKGTVEVLIDVDQIAAQMGERAMRSSRCKSTALGGAVVVRRVK